MSPVFQGYGRSIAEGFEAIGYETVACCYDRHAGILGIARNKIVFEGLDRVRAGSGMSRFVRYASDLARGALRSAHADIVVVVKGDLLDGAFWDELSESGLPHVLWLYDEFRRTRHDRERLASVGTVVSYSTGDVAMLAELGIRATHVPGAFDPGCVSRRVDSSDVIFVGARYPGRERTLVELRRRGVPIRAVGRDWSRRPMDRLRSWSWSRPDVPSQPSVSRSAAAGLAAGAVASLNLHENQDGFTMRTFEIAGAGGVQIIDRNDVGDLYEPGKEILVATDVDEMVEVVDRIRRDPAWASRVATAGRDRTFAEHTFAHRAAVLESLWD